MKRFLIHVSTYWCGMDNTFRAEAESELELYEIADQLAYENFQSYGCEADIAEEERIREELTKCFKCNSSLALGWLSELTELRDYIFTKTNLWLKPTNEK